MKSKTFIVVIAAVLLIAGAIGGAFIGGVAVGKNKEQENTTAQFPGQFNRGSQMPDGSTFPNDVPVGGNFMGRGTSGTITGIENGVITLTTQKGDTVMINTSSSTIVQKMETVDLSDIAIGDNITVAGETQNDGSIDATSISVGIEGMNFIPPTQTSP